MILKSACPPKAGRLFEDEIEILEQWIEEGANWPGQMNEKVKGRDRSLGFFFRQSARMFRMARRIPSMRLLTKRLKEAKISPNKEATP